MVASSDEPVEEAVKGAGAEFMVWGGKTSTDVERVVGRDESDDWEDESDRDTHGR